MEFSMSEFETGNVLAREPPLRTWLLATIRGKLLPGVARLKNLESKPACRGFYGHAVAQHFFALLAAADADARNAPERYASAHRAKRPRNCPALL